MSMLTAARSLRSLRATSFVAAVVCVACGSAGAGTPRATPTTFVRQVTNPWFPLKPGTTFIYEGRKDHEPGRDVVRVTARTKVINGVRCTEVDDRLYLNGRLAERTKDWYAQDGAGNVWYFGETTAELDRTGRVTSREGSWQAGVDGAKPGIFVPAHPKVGESHRQEYYKGHAEDHFRVVSMSAAVVVPYTASARAMLTNEWTPLEPGTLDRKLYVRGIGLVKEETIKGGDELWELNNVLHR
jgi:hypothetical protein